MEGPHAWLLFAAGSRVGHNCELGVSRLFLMVPPVCFSSSRAANFHGEVSSHCYFWIDRAIDSLFYIFAFFELNVRAEAARQAL